MTENNPTIIQTHRFTVSYKDLQCHLEFYVEPIENGILLDEDPENVIYNHGANLGEVSTVVADWLAKKYKNITLK